LLGAVKVAVPPAETSTSNIPVWSEVTEWVEVSELDTITFAPGLTDVGLLKAKSLIESTVIAVAEGFFEDGADVEGEDAPPPEAEDAGDLVVLPALSELPPDDPQPLKPIRTTAARAAVRRSLGCLMVLLMPDGPCREGAGGYGLFAGLMWCTAVRWAYTTVLPM
jgi:hypothetical protein